MKGASQSQGGVVETFYRVGGTTWLGDLLAWNEISTEHCVTQLLTLNVAWYFFVKVCDDCSVEFCHGGCALFEYHHQERGNQLKNKNKLTLWLIEYTANTCLWQKVIHINNVLHMAKCAQRWETDCCKVSPISIIFPTTPREDVTKKVSSSILKYFSRIKLSYPDALEISWERRWQSWRWWREGRSHWLGEGSTLLHLHLRTIHTQWKCDVTLDVVYCCNSCHDGTWWSWCTWHSTKLLRIRVTGAEKGNCLET